MFPEMPGCLAEGTGRVQFKTKKKPNKTQERQTQLT